MKTLKHLFMFGLFCMISLGASAEVYSGSCGDNAQWSLDTTTGLLSITGSGDMYDYIYSSSVKWYWYRNYITSLSIGDQITSIGANAFCGSGLTTVTIPNSVTSIGRYAFEDCSGLTSVTIPNSVTSIRDYAFRGCSGLTSMVVESGNTVYDSRDNCNALIETASNTLLTGCINTTIPNSVTSIGDDAFSGCSGLTSVTIPNSVAEIRSGAFRYCTGLTSMVVESGNTVYDSRDNCNALIETASNTLLTGCMNTKIPNSVTSIGNYAFSQCTGLTSVTIPNTVTKIGWSAFYNCSGLTSVTIPNSVTSIENYAFDGCSGLTSVIIGNSVTSIGDYAFRGCSGLTSMVVESGNTVYDSRDNCNALIETASNTLLTGCMNTTIPNSVTSIGDDAFRGCTGLTSVTIPNSVTEIGSSAFEYCSGLISVTIGNSVTSIGNYAFSQCTGLTSVYAKWKDAVKIPALTSSDFPYSTCDLYVPTGTKTIYEGIARWNTFRNIYEYEPTSVLLGDANDDGSVNVNDITTIATYILDGEVAPWNEKNADANEDGTINVNDITKTAEIILLRAKAEMEAKAAMETE